MMNPNNCNDRERLLNWINIVSFSLIDISLFLDTHPCDKEALEHFEHFSDLRKQAMKEYSENYGPLTLDNVTNYKKWDWALQPWPWEGGMS